MSIRTLGLLVCALALLPTVSWGADEETTEFKAQDLVLQVPKGWKETPVTSSLRLAQFEIPAVEGDSEPAMLAIFPPFGGSINENLQRWIGEFEPAGVKSEFTKGETEQGSYVLSNISGTFKKPVGPPIRRMTEPAPGYRAVGIILSSKSGGNYFLKLVGPDKTVSAAASSLRKAIKADQSKETKYEF